ncbi:MULTISPECIES: DUF922 domain-containing protein [unclassified Maribacter]|uniref:DUF922 domain-containing protein n=1 Tax=unclassified Maribacter TaxID=2615042 RepID=UPI00257E1C66|nr:MULTISPECIES: DUF922 domain-containing protein [unclassified Maribacter]
MGFVKRTYHIFWLLIVLCIASVQGQEEVEWSPEFRFTWKDFKGKVPSGSGAAATTASGISYDFSTFYENGEMQVDFNVYAYFYPTKSWYKPKICNEVTLLHEQLHFDITELYARKLRVKLANATFTDNVKEEVRKLYRSTIRQLNDFQNKYDAETNYSRNLPVQERWVKEIGEALDH